MTIGTLAKHSLLLEVLSTVSDNDIFSLRYRYFSDGVRIHVSTLDLHKDSVSDLEALGFCAEQDVLQSITIFSEVRSQMLLFTSVRVSTIEITPHFECLFLVRDEVDGDF